MIIQGIQLNANNEDMTLSGIYKIYSSICPEKLYIGSASKFIHRYRSHRSSINRNLHFSAKLQNYANKYGSEKLIFEIIEVVEDRNILINKEQYWMDKLNPYFNSVPYAIPTKNGCHLTPEGKERIRVSKLGNNYGKGHKMSVKNKEKIKLANRGRKMSDKQKEFLREINTGIKQPTGQIIKRMISILGKDRIQKIKEIQSFFASEREKEKRYGDEIKFLSDKYNISKSVIRNIKTGKIYSNFKNHEL